MSDSATRGKLTDRLRGIYRIPITDGLGAVGAGEEPDNPNEFVRHFDTTPIQKEAADRIDELISALRLVEEHYGEDSDVFYKVRSVLEKTK